MPFQMNPLRKFIPNVPSYGDFERAAVHVDVNFREKYPLKTRIRSAYDTLKVRQSAILVNRRVSPGTP